MIEFTAVTGVRVAANPMLVFGIEATDRGTQIVSAAGDVVSVREHFEDVQRKMAARAKSGGSPVCG